jgi:hypothetical protein
VSLFFFLSFSALAWSWHSADLKGCLQLGLFSIAVFSGSSQFFTPGFNFPDLVILVRLEATDSSYRPVLLVSLRVSLQVMPAYLSLSAGRDFLQLRRSRLSLFLALWGGKTGPCCSTSLWIFLSVYSIHRAQFSALLRRSLPVSGVQH